jgi:hypothetical protein
MDICPAKNDCVDRIKKCQIRLKQLLAEEDCHLEPKVIIGIKGITAQIIIVSNEGKDNI